MDKKYILALDQGTTSSRAILFDKNGRAVSVSQHEYPQIFPRDGWVEQDPQELWQSQKISILECLASAGADRKSIAAIGITNQRETTILWDKLTGEPVYNAIVWQCRRTAPFCRELKDQGKEQLISRKTGLIIDPYFSGTKIRWIMDNIPRAKELEKEGRLAFGNVDAWLIWKLTGGKAHVTDYTNASRTMLFNIDELKWDEELCSLLNVPMDILPHVLPSSGFFGEVDEIEGLEILRGVPILGVAGDQHAALFGQGCLNPGQAKNTYGTGCFLLMNTGEQRVSSKNQLLSTIAWGIDGKVEYALEGSVFNAGSVIKWLRDNLGIVSSAPECSDLAASVSDTGGIYIVPAFTGLGAPYWDAYARGTIVGMTLSTDRARIARAVIESIAYQVEDLIRAMEKDSFIRLTELRVDGGASQSDPLMQFQADLHGCPLDRPESVECTAMGAAMLAGLAAGFWKDTEETASLRRSSRVFTPDKNREKIEIKYSGWLKAVKTARLYGASR